MIDTMLSLITLIVLEVVLGVDNLIFLAILTARLPKAKRNRARHFGLSLAWITRIILLFVAMSVVQLTHPLFQVYAWSFSARDLFLIAGGIFLVWKAGQEIWYDLRTTPPCSEEAVLETSVSAVPMDDAATNSMAKTKFWPVVMQVGIMDMVFSIDSVLTAVGLTPNFVIMTVAITIAIIVMIFASEPASRFIERYPALKLIGLCFLILVGMFLVADGFAEHIERDYLYFALGFAITIELLKIYKRLLNNSTTQGSRS